MTPVINYYQILGVSKSATKEEIKKAYRQAVLFWHPDKNKSETAHEEFTKVYEAYSILSDYSKRAVYDRLYSLRLDSEQKQQEAASYDSDIDFKLFKQWVKEARSQATDLALRTIDGILTDTFDFLNHYGYIIFIVIVLIVFLALAFH